MNKINTLQELVDYIAIVCDNKLTSNIYIPGGLLSTKVQESYLEALNNSERLRLLELYKRIPNNKLLKMSIPGNSFKDLDSYLDLDEMNDFQDLNTLVYATIQHKLYSYYKSLPNKDKQGYVFYYSKIFKMLEVGDKKDFKFKTFLIIFSLLSGLSLYLAKDNLDAYYAIAVSLLIIIVGAGIYVVIKSFRSE